MRNAGLLAVLLFLGPFTCTDRAQGAYRDVLIAGVPHIRQKPDFCGEACAAMALRKLGHDVDQDYVFDRSGLDPIHGRGCHTAELARSLRRIGFQIGPVWSTVSAALSGPEMESQWRQLHQDLCTGVPSIICTRYADRPRTTEHFRLILGYDAATDEVIYHEAAERRGAYRRMKRELLLKLWPLKYKPRQWTVIRMRLKPGRIRTQAPIGGFTPADYAQHLMELKRKIPGPGFSIVVQPPFVVVGDGPEAAVRRRAERTVKWAVDRLKKDYFAKDPAEILDIWLFKDKASYRRHVRRIFGEDPSTPFGYYSSEHKALIMNIATGGGTLVHEIVHPFMASNFPHCPAWFNEGLASLYEQCGEKAGRIYGYTNWRLAGLQRAIRAGGVPSLKDLTGTTDRDFYHDERGTNYAQARYLCYYLQEKGLLAQYFKSFVKGAAADPGGYSSLQKVLGQPDMKAFQKKWEVFVLGLRFR